MIGKGGLVLPHYLLITHLRGTGLSLIRMTGALQLIPAENPIDQNLTHSLILEEVQDQDQGLLQNLLHILEVDRSPDLVPSQGAKGQHQSLQEEQTLS